MSHDPLCLSSANGSCCPWIGDCKCQCECDLIAAVRADNDREWLNNRGKSMVYAAALRDAVEAVKALPVHGPEGELFPPKEWEDNTVVLLEVIAAIEALGHTPDQQPKEHINPAGYDPAATENRP